MAKSSTRSRFRPVEIGKVDGTRTVVLAKPVTVTAFGGLPMLAEVEKRFGLIRDLVSRVHDIRDRNLINHEKHDIVAQRVGQIALGWVDGNDCDWLKEDPAILAFLDRSPEGGEPGASQETVSRFEQNAVNESNSKAVREFFVDHYISCQKRRPRIIELDFDGVMYKTYGAQEGSVYRGGKYKHTMYYPLKTFSGDWLLGVTLRRGDKAESKTIVPELKMIVGKLRARWRAVRIVVRMDSAFCSPELIQWLKKEKVSYEIALRPTNVLASYSKTFVEEVEKKFLAEHGKPLLLGKDGKKKAQKEHARIRGLERDLRMEAEEAWKQRRSRVVGEFCYKPESWDFLEWRQWERVICRCDYTDKGADVHYVLVSEQHGLPQKIYEDKYCKRGAAEQSIELFKQTGQRLSAQDFHANQYRLTLYGVAHMLLVHLRDFVCRKLRRAEPDTLRKILMVMPMIVQRTAKKTKFVISETHPHCWEFLDVWRKLKPA